MAAWKLHRISKVPGIDIMINFAVLVWVWQSMHRGAPSRNFCQCNASALKNDCLFQTGNTESPLGGPLEGMTYQPERTRQRSFGAEEESASSAAKFLQYFLEYIISLNLQFPNTPVCSTPRRRCRQRWILLLSAGMAAASRRREGNLALDMKSGYTICGG